MRYDDLFERNHGILTGDQQKRLRDARVLIVGAGGVGGTVATVLARSGVGRFTLLDPDDYEPTNANRQIACFSDTMGRNKAEVVGEELRRINPGVEVEAVAGVVPLDDIDSWIEAADLVFPAADDYAYSLVVFRRCQALGRPALLVVPAGYWATVSLVLPGGPTVERLHGIPPLPDYESLKQLLVSFDSRLAELFYTTMGGWRDDYFVGRVEADAAMAQLCPVVWTASSLGALEVVKHLTGSARPVTTPRYWLLTRRGGVRLRHMAWPTLYNLLALYRRLAYRVLQGPLGPALDRVHRWWWARFKRRAGG